jgi:hypothetical protein
MRAEERAALSDIRNLYVYSSSGQQKVPFHRGDARGGQTPRGGAARRGHRPPAAGAHHGGGHVIALFPLAAHGGPLWEPMCDAQIGGLTAAMFVTLLVVPVLYAIFVLDLKLVKWEQRHAPAPVQIGAAEIGAAAAV